MTKAQLLTEAIMLAPRDRDELAEQIWQSIREGELAPDQLAELRRRKRAAERGEVTTVDGEQVMREFFNHFAKVKAG
jgi:putative addiction module component (TIGR02574 family)